MGVLNSWSYSRLVTFEQCKFRAKLAYVDKIPEPEKPLPDGKLEHAVDRGVRVHTGAEYFVKEATELLPELDNFKKEFKVLRNFYSKGKVSVEGDWGYNVNWEPTSWRSSDAWLRVKLDCMVKLNEYEALVIDYKTGKKFGNEIKHGEQGQLYQLATFLRYPNLKKVFVEFWYIDQNQLTRTTYNKDQGLSFLKKFAERADALTNCEDFRPNPNKFSCKWCPYGPKGTGHCTVGIQ